MSGFRRQSVVVAVALIAGLAVTGCGRSTADRGNADPAPKASASAPVTTAGNTPTTGTRPAGSSCAAERAWGTGAKGGGLAMTSAALYQARVGKHACFDRVVFDINGPGAVGFDVGYVSLVSADASGEPVPVAGRAALRVIVRAPIYGTDSQGHQPGVGPPAVGEHLVAPAKIAGWRSLTAVTFAGSFEGQSTIAVGVQDRRPFRVLVTSEPGYRHVVLDIAH